MTNLETNKERIHEGMALCTIAHLCRYGEPCSHKICSSCEFNENVDECIKEVLAERKEPIKLKKWEYDLIRANDRPHECNVFESFNTYRNMKAMGYFEGITDTYMTLKEILENCEVEDR